ncbi:MAG: restriction endonuclease subunit S [Acidobacteria bacterium]|nr:restriction endonuclease subunit S [Acidobacteriota bacterium]
MSFPPYPKYKPSGVEWLGDVPEHWDSGSVRWLSQRYSGGTPDKTKLAYWSNGTIPWLNSGAVNDRLVTTPSTYITDEAFQNSSAKWIPKGALVMALAGQGKTKGMVAQLGIRTTCNQSMAAILPGNEITSRFLFWWLDSNYANIRNLAGGDLRDGLNLELLGSIRCPLPPLAEQTQIAAFLDRETGKIDELVAEQRRLIELLKEKRQAVISHAVTKGLNPNAPTKPSGIQWLGNIPEHWEVVPLKVITTYNDEALDEDTDLTEELLYVDISSVDAVHGICNKESLTFANAPSRARRRVKNGDVIVSTVRTYLKAIATIRNAEPNLIVSTGFAVIRPRPQLESRFLGYLLSASFFIEEVIARSTGVSYPAINASELVRIKVAILTFDEQTQIAEFLDVETAKLDALTAEAERAIELLQERRTALISSAVTGKIDVRNVGGVAA